MNMIILFAINKSISVKTNKKYVNEILDNNVIILTFILNIDPLYVFIFV